MLEAEHKEFLRSGLQLNQFEHKFYGLWGSPRTPDFLRKYDYLLITIGFLMIFWVEAITGMRSSPFYTALWLLVVTAAASVTGMLYSRHTWCRHLCPLGGFVGLVSVGGMLEVRSDTNVCLNKCTTFECYYGTPGVSGCPLLMHAPYVDNNIDCKLCLRCVRNCPNDAVQFQLRAPAREIWHLIRVNQGFAIFIGVALLMLIPIHYFEPLRQSWPLDKWRLWFSAAFWSTAIAAGISVWLIARPFKSKPASLRVKLVFAFIRCLLFYNRILTAGIRGRGSRATIKQIMAFKYTLYSDIIIYRQSIHGGLDMEVRKVFKSGNSFVVSLPKEVVDTFGVKTGDHIEFSLKGGRVTIKPYKKHDRTGVIKKVAGCLKNRDQLYNDLLNIRENEEDREDTTIE